MATISITKGWSDGDVLLESDLDAIKTGIETFLNTTKISDDNIQDAGITGSSKLIDATVTASKLASNSVITAKISDGALSADATGRAKMADLFVNTAKLADDAVTKDKLADGAKNVTATSKTADYTITNADEFIEVNTTGGNVTVTLPAAASNIGFECTVVKTSASNSLIVEGNALELINSAANFTMRALNESATFTSNGSQYYITRAVVPNANFEPVIVRASRASTQSIPNSTNTVIVHTSADVDNKSAYNTSTGKFTCPIAGYYQVSCTGYMNGTDASWEGNEYFAVQYRVNGSGTYYVLGGINNVTGNGANQIASGSDLVYLTVSDYLEFFAYQNSGGTGTLIADAGFQHMSICRVG